MANWNKFSNSLSTGGKNMYSVHDIAAVLGGDPTTASFTDLSVLRNSPEFKKDIPFQNAIAPFEHRAYNREQIDALPSKLDATKSAVAQGVLTAGYTPAKVLNNVVGAINPDWRFMQSRSQPSFDELAQGFAGIGEGLRIAYGK